MIAIIAAYTKNRVIGKDGRIPWILTNEKKRFRKLTKGNVVIMGRRTYLEIGHPLPDRINIVVSNSIVFSDENLYTVVSLNDALQLCQNSFPDKDIFISGGERLYRETIGIAEKLYLTEIDTIIEGDSFFPEFDEECFDKKLVAAFSEELNYRYLEYTRK